MKKILVVDDDTKLRYIIRLNLEASGYQAIVAENGKEGLALAREHQPDVVLLDVMMPDLDGFMVCRTLREDPGFPDCSVLFLTARGELDDKGEGFRAGGDDYLTKPFSPQEMLWRVEALLRRLRRPALPEAGKACGSLTFFPATFEVETPERRVKLTRLEYLLLLVLAETPGQVVSPEVLLRRVWNIEGEEGLATVRVHVNRVRQRLESAPESPRYLRTVRGRGYCLSGD